MTIFETYKKLKTINKDKKNILDILIVFINSLQGVTILSLNDKDVIIKYFKYEVRGLGKSLLAKLDSCMYRISVNYNKVKE